MKIINNFWLKSTLSGAMNECLCGVSVIEEADRILDSEPDLLKLPHDLPTLKTIEDARKALKKD